MAWIQAYEFSRESEEILKEIKNRANDRLQNDINPLEWMLVTFSVTKQIKEANKISLINMKEVSDTRNKEADKSISEVMEVDSDSDLVLMMTQPFTCTPPPKQLNDGVDLEKDEAEPEQQELCIYENLKESFHSATIENTEKVIEIFRTVPLHKVTSVCNYLELSKLEDVLLSNFLIAVLNQMDTLGFNSVEQILQVSLGEKLLNLQSNASRQLINISISVSKTLPSLMLAVVVIPLLQSSISNFQCDVLCRLMKDGFNADYRIPFLISIWKYCTPINERIIVLITSAIDMKISLTNENLTSLIRFLHSGSTILSNNLKFAKLLQSIIQKYGQIFVNDDIKLMEKIVNENTTFLKNSISSAFKKLKS